MRAKNSALIALMILAPALATARPLEGDNEIQKALVGNTISGENDGQPYSEYLMPDGRVSGMERDGAYTGHWRVSNGRICFAYDDENNNPGPWECVKVDVEGARIKWVDDNGDQSFATLAGGNPNHY
jgi:hypothetical protein